MILQVVCFVEDDTRYGLNLYFDSDIERLSFVPMPKLMSDAAYDQSLADVLAEHEKKRVFIMKRDAEDTFLNELHAAGKKPIQLGLLADVRGRQERDRIVYTVAGDFN